MVNRVLIEPTGLWVSKPGIAVSTSLNEDDYIFSSNFKASRIFKSGSVTVPAAGGQGPTEVSYGKTLNGIPMGIFYVLEGSNYIHPALQTVTNAFQDLLEYQAIFKPSSVSFLNFTDTNRVFYYVVKELET